MDKLTLTRIEAADLLGISSTTGNQRDLNIGSRHTMLSTGLNHRICLRSRIARQRFLLRKFSFMLNVTYLRLSLRTSQQHLKMKGSTEN